MLILQSPAPIFMFAHLVLPPIRETIYQDTSAVRIHLERERRIRSHTEQSARNQFVYWKTSSWVVSGMWVGVGGEEMEEHEYFDWNERSFNESILHDIVGDPDLCRPMMCQRLSFHLTRSGVCKKVPLNYFRADFSCSFLSWTFSIDLKGRSE